MLNYPNMTDHYIAPRRTVQLHAPVSQPDAAEETLQNNDLQQDAGVFSGTQKQPLPSPEDYTISVEQVREHFRSKGLSKSKDTVQRWCRTGELTCQKRVEPTWLCSSTMPGISQRSPTSSTT